MNPTLRFGSTGPVVRTLQGSLNQLPSQRPALNPDGRYGPLTQARVREFQSSRQLVADGVFGPLSWAALEQWLNGLPAAAAAATAAATTNEHPLRAMIAQVAWQEWMNHGALVHATQSGGTDPKTHRHWRRGHKRLMLYFSVSAPKPGHPGSTYYGDDNVRFLQQPGVLAPCKHWCGIFALWAVKTAMVPVGTWIDSKGIASVLGFNPKVSHTPRRGDIAYRQFDDQGRNVNHHAVVFNVYDKDGKTWVTTIDGNSSMTSTITKNDKPAQHWNGYFSVAMLA